MEVLEKQEKTPETAETYEDAGKMNHENTDNTITSKEKTCFIITPIGPDDSPIRRHINGLYELGICPVLEEYCYKSEIPHRIPKPGTITNQIINLIYSADLVIANLTDLNPNVMYELALRHCFNKPVILIAEKGTTLPFDIIIERTISYVNDAQGIIDFKHNLTQALSAIEKEPNYTSPVVQCLRNFKFTSIIEESVDTHKETYTTDSIYEAIEKLTNRLENIENEIKHNMYSPTLVKHRASTVTYTLSSSKIPPESFDELIKNFIESCKKFGLKIEYNKSDETSYDITFLDLSDVLYSFMISNIEGFCFKNNVEYSVMQ